MVLHTLTRLLTKNMAYREFFSSASFVAESSPERAVQTLVENVGDIPRPLFTLCSRLINRISEISGEGTNEARRLLSFSVIAFILATRTGEYSLNLNLNRLLAQIENVDRDLSFRSEIIQTVTPLGFVENEYFQIPWYSNEGEGEEMIY